MHRFGQPLDVEQEAMMALEDLERGELPDEGDFAALLFESVVRKNRRVIEMLAALRRILPEE